MFHGKNGNFLCTMQRFSVIPVGLLYRQFFMSHGKNGNIYFALYGACVS